MKIIYCIFKSGRNERYKLINQKLAPQEFFYGILNLKSKGYKIVRFDQEIKFNGIYFKFLKFKDLLFNHLHKLGLSFHVLQFYFKDFKQSNILISFTDGLSLSIGYYGNFLKKKNLYLIGCFHCLSDYESRLPKFLQFFSRFIIKKGLKNLDHLAFFGPADRRYILNNYNLDANKTSIIDFGVDTDFWVPSHKKTNNIIFSIGQDPNRDFETLVKVSVKQNIRIHTNLKIINNYDKKKFTISKGSFYKSKISDLDLRKLYQESFLVIVPLKDVYQPSGQSVTLQAMSCGKVVILTSTKGIWSPKILKHRYNCYLVPPYSEVAIENAICELTKNKFLRDKISKNARSTVLKYYNLDVASASLEKILKKGL